MAHPRDLRCVVPTKVLALSRAAGALRRELLVTFLLTVEVSYCSSPSPRKQTLNAVRRTGPGKTSGLWQRRERFVSGNTGPLRYLRASLQCSVRWEGQCHTKKKFPQRGRRLWLKIHHGSCYKCLSQEAHQLFHSLPL